MAQVSGAYEYNVEVRSRFAGLNRPASEDEKIPKEVLKTKNQPPQKVKNTPATFEPPATASRDHSRTQNVSVPEHDHVSPHEYNQKPARGQDFTRGGGRGRGERGTGGRDHYIEANSNIDDQNNELRYKVDNHARRGRGAGRGRGYGDHRDFDRHSGSEKTGVKPVIKRDGHGTGNWGTVEDEIEATMEPVPEGDVEVEKSAEVVEEEIIEPAKEPKTLDEYKAEQKAKQTPAVRVGKVSRKPNDGKDVFKNMLPHQKFVKQEESDNEVEEVIETKDDSTIIDYGFSDRRGRGGRGRGESNYDGRGGFYRGRGQGYSNDREDGFRGGRGGGRGRGFYNEDRYADAVEGESRGGRGRGRGSRGNFSGENRDCEVDEEGRQINRRGRGGYRGGFSNDDGGGMMDGEPRFGRGGRGGFRRGYSAEDGTADGETRAYRGGRGGRGGYRGGYSHDEENVDNANGEARPSRGGRGGRGGYRGGGYSNDGDGTFDGEPRSARGRGGRGGYRVCFSNDGGYTETHDGDARPFRGGRGGRGGSRGGFSYDDGHTEGEGRPSRGRGGRGGGGFTADETGGGFNTYDDGSYPVRRGRGGSRGRGNFGGRGGGYSYEGRTGDEAPVDGDVQQPEGGNRGRGRPSFASEDIRANDYSESETRSRGRGRRQFDGGFQAESGNQRGREVESTYKQAPRIDNNEDFPELGH